MSGENVGGFFRSIMGGGGLFRVLKKELSLLCSRKIICCVMFILYFGNKIMIASKLSNIIKCIYLQRNILPNKIILILGSKFEKSDVLFRKYPIVTPNTNFWHDLRYL